jgi:HEAT repeat protein/beta-lactamase regulating signal transducer with metallopeptidase domain
MMSLAVEYAEPAADLVAWGCGILIQSTLLISVGLAACGFLRRRSAALRSSVLRATLLAVLVCPVVTGIGGLGMVDVPVPHQTAAVSEPTNLLVPSPTSAERRPSSARGGGRLAAVPMTMAPATSQVPAQGRRASLPLLYFALAICWVLGAGLLLVRLSGRCLRVQCLRSSARPGPEHVVEACREMARRMGLKAPRVMVSPAAGSPFLMGTFRPAILLPEACPSLANAQVFAHELAHLRRHDCFWSTLCRFVTALCFFQPLMWKLAGQMDQANEEACDDFVLSYVGQRQVYACRLVDMAQTLGYCASERLGLGVVNLRSSLGRRVQRILSSGTSHAIRTRHSEMLSVVLLGGLAVFLVSFLGAQAAVSSEGSNPFADGAVEPDVLPLVKALASGDWRTREQAAIALAQMAGAKAAAIPALIDVLADAEWPVRKAAAVALTTTNSAGRGAVSALIAALQDEEWQVRRPAAEALAVMGPASEPAVPALSNALRDEEWHVRRAAATALTAIGLASEPAVPALITALGDEEWHVRRAAAKALAAIGPASRPSTPQLLRRLDDEQWHVRESAALALGAIGPDAAVAIPTLIERLEDPEMQVRRAAASALERIAVGDKAAIPEIIDALLDTEWKRRQATAQSLERLL